MKQEAKMKKPALGIELGEVLVSDGARAALTPGAVKAVLAAHACGQWGKVDEEMILGNLRAILNGGRVVSRFLVEDSDKAVVAISDVPRGATRILMGSELEGATK